MAHEAGISKGPKEYNIPSRSYGITGDEAADVLITASEIKAHKELNKAALKSLKATKKAINDIT